MRLVIDIDSTICHTDNTKDSPCKYILATPIKEIINKINKLYDEGNYIIFHTARGVGVKITSVDIQEVTRKQLKDWGIKYHEVRFDKPYADIYVDDRSITPEMFLRYNIKRDE